MITREQMCAEIRDLKTSDLIKISVSEAFQLQLLKKIAADPSGASPFDEAAPPVGMTPEKLAIVHFMDLMIIEAEAELDRRIPIQGWRT